MEVGTVYECRVLQSVCHMPYFNWFGFCLSCLPESLIGFQTLYINIDLISISLDMERRPWEVAVDPPTKTIVSTFQFLSEKSSLFCNHQMWSFFLDREEKVGESWGMKTSLTPQKMKVNPENRRKKWNTRKGKFYFNM